MKRLLILTSLSVLLLFLANCGEDGPPGPQGPQGPQGLPGESGFVFEYENVDFFGPNYEVFLDFGDFEVLPSDVALVYFLWEVQDNNGQPLEIWRQLPQTIFHPSGLLIYNFDFAITDVRLFLETDFPPEFLAPIDTDDWIVRVVIAPGDFVTGSRVDLSNYDNVKEKLGLPDLPKRNSTGKRR